MADYIYLLENRLSAPQRAALAAIREISKSKGLTVFLVGGAVRDLTTGSPVRDLDVVVQGNASKLKKDIQLAGATITGENESAQTLYANFPQNTRMEIGSTLSVTFPKPGKPVVKPATILEDLRRRDFTANAMALSLNDGSYGLLMDPLNGVADIENRQLRLVSNYGFIEDPVRMIRATRLMARLGWTLDEKTQSRYDTGKAEGYISVLSEFHRGYEAEEIIHEEDPLRILKRLEAEGWMKVLAPYWTSAKVNVGELDRLREVQTQLQLQGIHPDPSAANFPLLTSKLSDKEVSTLKQSFPRKGFVTEIEALESQSKDFTASLSAKSAAAPSAAWRLLTSASPEAVLWTAFSVKTPAIQAKLKSFANEWPQARTRIPYTLMQEMRITPDLPGHDELLEKLFFELMDGHLETVEEMKAFLEPFSPPAPPPPISMRRPRAVKATKTRSRKSAKLDDSEEQDEVDVPAAVTPTPGGQPPAPVESPTLSSGPSKKSTPPTQKPLKPSPSKLPPVAAAKPVKLKPAPAAVPARKPAPPQPVKAVAKKIAVKAVASARIAKKQPAKTSSKKAPSKAPATKAATKLNRGGKGIKAAAKLPAKKAAPKPPAKKVVAKPVSKKAAKSPVKSVPAKTTRR